MRAATGCPALVRHGSSHWLMVLPQSLLSIGERRGVCGRSGMVLCGVGPPTRRRAEAYVRGPGQERRYTNLTGGWFGKEMEYTKYRISKPVSENSTFDDIYLSDPRKEDFVKFTKEAPLFLRFLKLVCDLENRTAAFVQFAKRCENGLLVEKDVFITKDELLTCVWRNGYSQAEINAFEIAFPSDYKFHYPELAALFDLSEKHCYDYCLRQRAKHPENLVELLSRKPTHLLSSYGLLFLGVWNGLSNQVLSNAWFYTKTFPFGAVFFMLAAYFRNEIRTYMNKHTKESAQQSLLIKRKYDETLYTQMKRYANDARCLEFLASFQADVQSQLAKYREALLLQHQQALVDRLTQKLVSIKQAERAIQGTLQEVIVREVITAVRNAFQVDLSLEEKAFSSAVQLIGSPTDVSVPDPVTAHVRSSLAELGSLGKGREGAAATKVEGVADRVARIFEEKEKEFMDLFTVKAEECAEVQRLSLKCRSDNDQYDFRKLQDSEYQRLETLYRDINNRVGFEVAEEKALRPLVVDDPASRYYAEYVNEQIEAAATKIRNARLTAFAAAFQ